MQPSNHREYIYTMNDVLYGTECFKNKKGTDQAVLRVNYSNRMLKEKFLLVNSETVLALLVSNHFTFSPTVG